MWGTEWCKEGKGERGKGAGIHWVNAWWPSWGRRRTQRDEGGAAPRLTRRCLTRRCRSPHRTAGSAPVAPHSLDLPPPTHTRHDMTCMMVSHTKMVIKHTHIASINARCFWWRCKENQNVFQNTSSRWKKFQLEESNLHSPPLAMPCSWRCTN